MADRHRRRNGDDYTVALSGLLPQGLAWPRDPSSVVMKVVKGLANYWGWIDGRIADLLERESDPRLTLELLPDWERAWGLPDPCFEETLTIDARRKMLVWRMTLLGSQSREFYRNLSVHVGHQVVIREFAPFMCGISRCGMTLDDTLEHPRWQLGPPELRFYWTIRVDQARLNWFRVTSSQCGVDPHLRIGLNTEMPCLIERWKPAHTQVLFDYSYLAYGSRMAGTP